MDPIKAEVRINQTVEVSIDPDDILEQINELPLTQKWNYIGYFINNIQVSVGEMTNRQKEAVHKYLESKLKLFEANQEVK